METVVRIYDAVTGSHIYTRSKAEISQLIEDGDRYRDEGAVFESAGPNPVARFRNQVTGGIFYAISPEEQAAVRQNPGFTEIENGGFNATINPRLGVEPVYRFYNTVTDRHFFTSNAEEAASVRSSLPGYRDEGIGFYADPLGDPPFPAATPIQPNSSPPTSFIRPLRPGNPLSNFSDEALAAGGLIPGTNGATAGTTGSTSGGTTSSATNGSTSGTSASTAFNTTGSSATTGNSTSTGSTGGSNSNSIGTSLGTPVSDGGTSSGGSSGNSSSGSGSSSGSSSSGSGSSGSSSGGSGSSGSGSSSSGSGGSSGGGGSSSGSSGSGSSGSGAPSDSSSSSGGGASSGGPTPDASSVGYGAFEQQVLSLVNDARSAEGLSPLSHDPLLGQAAEAHSADMLARDFFAHTNPDNKTARDRILDAGFTGRTGENIAAGFSTPSSVVTAWLNSSGHRANILNPNYTKIGLSHVFSSNDPGNINDRHYWTQKFNG